MTIVLPLHLLYLHFSTGEPISAYAHGLAIAVKRHLASVSDEELAERTKTSELPIKKFVLAILRCTVGITAPALLWFAALTLSS